MKNPRLNYLLIVPFDQRLRVKGRIERGEPVFGGVTKGKEVVQCDTDEEARWREPPPPPVEAKTEPCFEVLGLPETATLEEVKARFKALAVIHHPDKPGGDEERFKQIQAARVRCLEYLKAKAVLASS